MGLYTITLALSTVDNRKAAVWCLSVRLFVSKVLVITLFDAVAIGLLISPASLPFGSFFPRTDTLVSVSRCVSILLPNVSLYF